MSAPVQLSDLDITTVADDGDLTLIRKNDTTDYKITAANMRKINIPGLPVMSTSPVPLDLMIISQAANTPATMRQCFFGSIGLAIGTKVWFYQSNPPNGVSPVFWKIAPGTGDKLLAVKGNQGYTNAGQSQGTWQQENHVLTESEIPAHTHSLRMDIHSAGQTSEIGLARAGKSSYYPPSATTQPTGGGQGHNHGKTWRPYAYVGIICQKAL